MRLLQEGQARIDEDRDAVEGELAARERDERPDVPLELLSHFQVAVYLTFAGSLISTLLNENEVNTITSGCTQIVVAVEGGARYWDAVEGELAAC